MGYNRENDLYGRALTGYGLNYQQNQDTYGRQQDYLNRLAAISGLGQTGISQAGQAGANLATGTTNALFANALNQANAANTKYGSINNAIQGGTQNWLLNNYLSGSSGGYTPYEPYANYYS
jgi:3-hydroxyisobutyrate dehydrogenase-like beta-hydroxyacid dehydrogenase